MQPAHIRSDNVVEGIAMDKAAKDALSNFKNWSVKDWSVQSGLLTLHLMHFMFRSKEDEDEYYRASWGFVRPSRITFSNFTARNDAMIQKIDVSAPAKGLTTYRLEFKDDSFIEVVARECATVQW